jgi:hypothetical protein
MRLSGVSRQLSVQATAVAGFGFSIAIAYAGVRNGTVMASWWAEGNAR